MKMVDYHIQNIVSQKYNVYKYIKDYNVKIDGRNFFNQPINNVI